MNAFAPHPGALDLSGAWRLESRDGGMAAAMALPGDVHSALIAAALIPDPCVPLALTAQKPALHVVVEAPLAGHFSDNAFDILPGETAAIIFTPDDPATAVDVAAFVVRDLHSSHASRSN